MSISRRKKWLANAMVLVAAFASVTFTCFAQSENAKAQPAALSANTQLSFSPGIRDILKMMDAKVDIEVIKAYIKNAPIPFNLSASEIIALARFHGVPDELITALILRGAEVRDQMAQGMAGQAPPMVNAPATPPAAYPYDYGAGAPYNPYPYDYADYGFGYLSLWGAPYNLDWWWNNYGYPWAFYSPFFFGFGHRFGDFDRFHRFDRFHGNRGFASQGRSGFANRGAAWASARGVAYRPSVGQAGFAGRRSFAFTGARTGGFVGHAGGFAGRSGGFGGHAGGFGGHGGGGHR